MADAEPFIPKSLEEAATQALRDMYASMNELRELNARIALDFIPAAHTTHSGKTFRDRVLGSASGGPTP